MPFYRSGLDGQYNSDFGVCLSFAKPASNIVGNAIIESQRTARFIRWLQTALYRKDSAADIMTKLKRVWYPKNPELFHTDPQDMKENKLEKSLPVKGTFDIIHVNGNDAVGNLLRGK